MRRPRWSLVVVVVATVTATAVMAVARRWERDERPMPPSLTFTQDDEVVRVTLHNENSEWGLRNQAVRLHFRSAENLPIRTFGYDMEHTVVGRPGVTFRCCVITYLPPDGEFTFELPAPDRHVDHVQVNLREEAGWVRM